MEQFFCLQYFGAPVTYVQQIVVKSMVTPWDSTQLIPSDAFRAALETVFDVVQHVDNIQVQDGSAFGFLSLKYFCIQFNQFSDCFITLSVIDVSDQEFLTTN